MEALFYIRDISGNLDMLNCTARVVFLSKIGLSCCHSTGGFTPKNHEVCLEYRLRYVYSLYQYFLNSWTRFRVVVCSIELCRAKWVVMVGKVPYALFERMQFWECNHSQGLSRVQRDPQGCKALIPLTRTGTGTLILHDGYIGS